MVLEKLMYSRKFLALMLFLLYIITTYTIAEFTYTSIAVGTTITIFILAYLAYYAHLHHSGREALALTMFIVISMLFGILTGNAIKGFNNMGSNMYAISFSISSILLILALSKLYKK